MRTFLLPVVLLLAMVSTYGQQNFKTLSDKPYVEPKPIQLNPGLPNISADARQSTTPAFTQLHSIRSRHESIERMQVLTSGALWIDLHENQLWPTRSSVSDVIKTVLSFDEPDLPVDMEWVVTKEIVDENNLTHIRTQQTLGAIPIKGQELVLHIERGDLRDLNGFAWAAGLPKELPAAVPSTDAIAAAKAYLVSQNVKFQTPLSLQAIAVEPDAASLIWIPQQGKLILAYMVEMHPNVMDHWTIYVNASTLEIMQAIAEKCAISPHHLFAPPSAAQESSSLKSPEGDFSNAPAERRSEVISPCSMFHAAEDPLDGATTTTDQDLLNQNRTVNGYQVGTNFFMIDASRTGMYQSNQSVMPNEPVGVIWTVDANNSSPQQSNFEVFHVSNTNNNWDPLEVSAHYNAGVAYEYFLSTFGRNSINGSGGNIVSIINVTDENDNDLDNAFWSGSAMFYGNGNTSFKELARGLDVAGHEMSHGVIDNTANLEYVGQSGALNESYADVFGAMVDRDDWKIGEDVILLSAFPSGTMRDMENPNNGGNQFGDRGWQPKHMNEFVNLPNTPDADNGGVHINSGIPNRAFFLIATAIGKDKAEQIYYKALRDYLVKSSQFVDMRAAAEKAAVDLHGNNSPELDAVRNGFNTVGIGSGQGGDYEEDIETNDGTDFILATDAQQSDLYWIPPGNPNQFVKMEVPAPISRPSFTDNGAACVYVDIDQNMILINFDWSSGLNYQAFYLEDNPQGIWRNVVVSKDGQRIAFTTANLRNEINVYDLPSGASETFELFNPTTAQGIETGDVLYADAMEWDYSGNFLMYDAFNRIESNFGDGIEYWDIGFLTAWNANGDVLGDGYIGKLFATLPENISIGNPSFAKNSPYIITFDFLETYFDGFGSLVTDYWIIAANVESGALNNIYQNTTVGYPSYSRLDDKILFTYDNFGQILLATIDVDPQNKILPVTGTDVVLIEGAQKGVWFTVGNRDFTAVKDVSVIEPGLIRPQPANEMIEILDPYVVADAAYQVFDMMGKRVQEGIMSNRRVEVKSLGAGTYILELGMNSGQVMTARFAKL